MGVVPSPRAEADAYVCARAENPLYESGTMDMKRATKEQGAFALIMSAVTTGGTASAADVWNPFFVGGLLLASFVIGFVADDPWPTCVLVGKAAGCVATGVTQGIGLMVLLVPFACWMHIHVWAVCAFVVFQLALVVAALCSGLTERRKMSCSTTLTR